MNSLTPTYRIVLNKNLLDPLFIWYLKQEFHRLVTNAVIQGHLNLETKYKFTVYSIPPQWGNYIIPKIRANEVLPSEKQDPKLVKLAEILHQLDPSDSHPVNLEFELWQIITFVTNNVKHYQEITPGGIVDYFGIETQLWFDDYPIQTGTILKAVDYGTLDNRPLHLFDSVFEVIRVTLLDLYAQFIKYIKQEQPVQKVVIKDVDI